jgi:diguanylate cyclase (GGDEF)-like protein
LSDFREGELLAMTTQSDIIRVLLIEDNPADVRLVRECFAELKDVLFLINDTNCITTAVNHVSEQHFDIILLDLSLPDSIGLETLHHMHSHAPSIPIIVLTGLDDDDLALTAMRHGAQDYLLKGQFDINLLSRVIRYTIERKRAETEIKKLAYYDTLTGLPNRVLFTDRLRQAIILADRDQRGVALMFLDLDHFKKINDSLGHAYGDRLLKITADRIQSCLRSSDTVARLGGDEFVVVLPLVSGAEDVPKVANKILDVLKQPVHFDDHDIYTSVSIGIALFPTDAESLDDLLKNADIAMYQAKERGRNNFQFFSRDMNELALSRQRIESGMRQALARQEFYLEYQPQFDIGLRTIVGVEALVRWKHPQNGRIAPTDFISIAEETGLIIPLGEWILRTACCQARKWHDIGYNWLRVAVNISARQFKQSNFVTLVSDILTETGMNPNYLELELTESTIMERADQNILALQELKNLGIKLAIDDFGTGYSSLSYLKHFPIDRLKIDRSFVRDINTDSDDAAIAEAIIVMAHSLKLNVVAEGVEQEAQLDFLHSKQCDELQGFLMSHPLSVHDVTEFLAATKLCP